MTKLISVAVFLLVTAVVYGQFTLSGKVVDKSNGNRLAFANIIINNDPSSQIMSDIDGNFSIILLKQPQSLRCSYVGYQAVELSQISTNMTLSLTPLSNALDEVIVAQGANPANRIIQNVIRNKSMNNPENVTSFQYQCYNKVNYDFKTNSHNTSDSLKIQQTLKGGHLFMMESQTQRKFIAPNLSEEKVIATKVSGFKNPSFATLATDIQPFSFYKDAIRLLNLHYLNPIADSGLKKYKFRLEETLLAEGDTIFIISFKPLPFKNFDALTGLLYINSNKYAVQNVIAYPFEKGKIDLKIQQRYRLVDNYWFPDQLNYTLTTNEYPSKNIGMIVDGKSYISDVLINIPLQKKAFAKESVFIADDAQKDEAFWENIRKNPLSTREAITYQVIDSIGKKEHLDSYVNLLEKLVHNKIPVSWFDVDLSKTLTINQYEGLRLGTGIFTNEKISRYIILGGFLGYGIKDEKWKYGAEILLKPFKNNDIDFGIRHQNSLLETGDHGLRLYNNNLYNFRNILGFRFDNIVQNTMMLNFRASRSLSGTVAINQTAVKPLYDYEFHVNDKIFTRYKNSDISLFLRFAYKDNLVKSLNTTFSTGTKYPIFTLLYSKGFQNVADGDFNYNKIELAAEQSFYTANFGTTRYRLETGYIDNLIPLGLLFSGEGNNNSNFSFFAKNTFQTMQLYEFLSDRYAHLFLTHNFGTLLFKSKIFQPDLILHNNFGWGELSRPGNHKFVSFKTKEKVFFETGLQLDNVLKINAMNLGYLGMGLATFYRYGYYSMPDQMDNFVYKFTISFSIK